MISQDMQREQGCDDDDVGFMPRDGFMRSFRRFNGEAIPHI